MLNLHLREIEPWTRGAPVGADTVLEAHAC